MNLHFFFTEMSMHIITTLNKKMYIFNIIILYILILRIQLRIKIIKQLQKKINIIQVLCNFNKRLSKDHYWLLYK